MTVQKKETLGERIRNVRLHIGANGLSQKAFGEKLGVIDTTVSGWESDRRTPSEAILFSICREFKASYQYLTEGIGDMFSNLPETLIDELADEYNLSDIDREIVASYLKLPNEKREMIAPFLKNMFTEK